MNTMTTTTDPTDADDDEPQFESVAAMCLAFNWPASMCAKIEADMEATGLPERVLH